MVNHCDTCKWADELGRGCDLYGYVLSKAYRDFCKGERYKPSLNVFKWLKELLG